ncbi:MAG TPA: EAL domain-containing protein [Marinagarivorans sp.]
MTLFRPSKALTALLLYAGGCIALIATLLIALDGGPLSLLFVAVIAGCFAALSGLYLQATCNRLTLARTEQICDTYRDAIQATPFAVAIYDENDQLVDCNDAYHSIHSKAFAGQSKLATYQALTRATAHPLVAPQQEQLLAERLANQRQTSAESTDRLYPDGRWQRESKHRTRNGALVSYSIDISDIKARELQLDDSENRYRALTQVAPVGIWQVSTRGQTLFHNNALISILGCNDETPILDLRALESLQILQSDKRITPEQTQARLLQGKHPLYTEASLAHMPNKTLFIARSKAVDNHQGETSYLMVVQDVSQRKQAERDIRYLAEHDPLTGLANRSMLNTQLRRWLDEKSPFAIALLDLDHFKDVNDSLGHQIGDRLIKEAAFRLKKTLRANDFASRLGGDEFAIILPGIADLAAANTIIERIYAGFKEPVIIDDNILQISASSGIALHPDHGDCEQELIQHAEIALYHQKNLGRGSFTLFETALASAIQARKDIEQDLRRALHNDKELSVYYQPQYALHNGQLTGLEALVRWHNHRTQSWVSPADFIPIAEQSGLIYLLDKFVLKTAAAQVHQWHQTGHEDIVLASNLSTMHFRGDALTTLINDVLKTTRIAPHRLELEITEGLFLEEQSHATEQLTLLRKKGIRVAVDDFGTGYSNLGYLNNLPVDCLKIDQSFIDNFDKDNYYQSIVKFIIELGHNLGLDIVAEGIETQDQLDVLVALQCSHGQGYFLARPQPAQAIEALLQSMPKHRAGLASKTVRLNPAQANGSHTNKR